MGKYILFLILFFEFVLASLNKVNSLTFHWIYNGTGTTQGYLYFENIGQQYPDTLSITSSTVFSDLFSNSDQVVSSGDLSTWNITGGNGFFWNGDQIQESDFEVSRLDNSNFYNLKLVTNSPGSYFCQNPSQPLCLGPDIHSGDYEYNPPTFTTNSLAFNGPTESAPSPLPVLGLPILYYYWKKIKATK